jgi:hypothetical protein
MHLPNLRFVIVKTLWTINKTQHKFFAKMHFNLLNFARKLFLMLLKILPPPPALKIYLHEIALFIPHYKYPNNLYLSKISWREQICEIESRLKIDYFFLIHPVDRKIDGLFHKNIAASRLSYAYIYNEKILKYYTPSLKGSRNI